jgi:2'-5' RNA ligase
VALLTAALLGAYRVAWSVGLLVRSGKEHRLPPHGPGPERHLTAVSRVPAQQADDIARALEPLRASGQGHYFYPPETIHLTIRNLDGLDAEALDTAATVLSAAPAFELELRGLNVSSHTVFVQALPRDDTLRSLRRRLDDVVHKSPRRRLSLNVAHVNVLRFRGRVARSLLVAVARRRSLALGTLRIESVEIVETDRLLSTAGTRTIRRIALGAG